MATQDPAIPPRDLATAAGSAYLAVMATPRSTSQARTAVAAWQKICAALAAAYGKNPTAGELASITAAENGPEAALLELNGKHCDTCRCANREGDDRWNDAVDWLLNSRHCADPDIQGAFWALVEGKTTRDNVDSYDYRQEEGAG